ncbi:MAG: dihydrolipoamide acetyltransferase family protein [Candidatus Auribacterota bacterium]|jgi:pyruvate dehydrogenase E2 component (dihydrolipoamide acetyltransferase)|nr:dihydrolipoamide acetyltransferase family protein [Candidatus Auribacterota bacterium]
MADILVMLALSPTMETGTITGWRVKEGDEISSGDVICDVETDKASMEYEATSGGTVLKILLDQGSKAAVGQPIAIVGDKGEDIADILKQAKSAQTQEKKQEPKENKPESQHKTAQDKPQPAQSVVSEPQSAGRIKASPLAKKIAEQMGIDLASVAGSGPGGRIVKQDLERAGTQGVQHPRSGLPELKDESIPVSGKRAVIAQRLSESKLSAPHYYLKISACVDNLVSAREELKKSAGINVSYNAFLMAFATQAISRHPMINSSWHGDTIKKHRSVDIGIAVALDDGLITPVVRNCAQKGIIAINTELTELIAKARRGTLTPEEYTGATFTISSLGAFGIEEFTAIINPPASTILAVGAMEKRPVADSDSSISVRTMMTMTLSCDHRIIDGAVGAAFMQDLKRTVEYPVQSLY